jgi:outer membrane protein assembly factor BamE (lipoprotein component of BamABCDE complex)
MHPERANRSSRRTARRKWVLLSAGLAAGLAAGCATIGHDFPAASVHQVTIGQTTQDEILRMFGQPWRTGIEDGKTTWTYGYYKYPLVGRKRSRDLVLRFDDNKVVKSYTFNTTEPQDTQPQPPPQPHP